MKRMFVSKRYVFCLTGLFLIFSLLIAVQTGGCAVKLGLENLVENHLDLIENKRLGIIANHTSLDSKGRHIVDVLSKHAKITTLFGPEHGFQGNVEDGASIENDKLAGIQLFSIYGSNLTPTPKMLENVDVLIYDIQDVGVKFYTFVSNLFLAMCAAKREGIPIIVLDRPNPINADIVEGEVTNPVFSSFVGVMPLPVRYGMTVGELAELFNNETYGGFAIGADLTVIEMSGYERGMWYDETGLPWTAPSPNMQTLETAIVYPGMCLFEGCNIAEGRGTDAPFLIVGAPYINGKEWLKEIPDTVLKGIKAEPVQFTPAAIPEKVNNPKYKNKACQGIHLHVTDREALRPIPLAVSLLCATRKLYPEEFQLRKHLDKLWGNENLRAMLNEGAGADAILKTAEEGPKRFLEIRKKYLRYD